MPTPPDPIRFLMMACEGTRYRVEDLDPFSHNLARVSDGERSFLAGGGALHTYPLNGAASVAVAQDKAHSYQVLRAAGLPVPRGEHFFLSPYYRGARPGGRELADAVAYADRVGFPLFVKPNTASRGAYAVVVHDRVALLDHLVAMRQRHLIGLIQEVLTGEEWRLFVLDGVVRYAHRKLPAVLVGDGEQSVAEMVGRMDRELLRNGLPPLDRGSVTRCLVRLGLVLESVLPIGQTVPLEGRNNLSLGGRAVDFTDAVPLPVEAFCRSAAKALGLRVCGIDVMARKGLSDPAGFTILEVNGNPGLTALETLGKTDVIIALWQSILGRAFLPEGS